MLYCNFNQNNFFGSQLLKDITLMQAKQSKDEQGNLAHIVIK